MGVESSAHLGAARAKRRAEGTSESGTGFRKGGRPFAGCQAEACSLPWMQNHRRTLAQHAQSAGGGGQANREPGCERDEAPLRVVRQRHAACHGCRIIGAPWRSTRKAMDGEAQRNRELGFERVEDPSQGAGAEPLPGCQGRALTGVQGQSPWSCKVFGGGDGGNVAFANGLGNLQGVAGAVAGGVYVRNVCGHAPVHTDERAVHLKPGKE